MAMSIEGVRRVGLFSLAGRILRYISPLRITLRHLSKGIWLYVMATRLSIAHGTFFTEILYFSGLVSFSYGTQLILCSIDVIVIIALTIFRPGLELPHSGTLNFCNDYMC